MASSCGGDDDDDMQGVDASMTTPPAMTPSTTQDSGTTTVMTAKPVQCGDSLCSPPANPIAAIAAQIPGVGDLLNAIPTAQACCFDEGKSTCGVAAMAGATCEARAVSDTRCPRLDAGPLSTFLAGAGFPCCTADNMCGVDGSLFGRGCVENGEVMSMFGAAGLSAFIMPPAAQACDAPPPEDAGMDGSVAVDSGMEEMMDMDGGQ